VFFDSSVIIPFRREEEGKEKKKKTAAQRRQAYERYESYYTCKEYSSAELDRMYVENQELEESEKKAKRTHEQIEVTEIKRSRKHKKQKKSKKRHETEIDRPQQEISVKLLNDDEEEDDEEEEKYIKFNTGNAHNKTVSTAYTSGLHSVDLGKDKMSKSLNVGHPSKEAFKIEKLKLPTITEELKGN
jgi:hypothetical protein